jgi:hypothetical protein
MYRIVFKAEDIINTEGSAAHFDPLLLEIKREAEIHTRFNSQCKDCYFSVCEFPILVAIF